MEKQVIQEKKGYIEKINELILKESVDLREVGLEHPYTDYVDHWVAIFDDDVVASIDLMENEEEDGNVSLYLSVTWLKNGDAYCTEPGSSFEATRLDGKFYDNGKNTEDGATHMVEIVGF